MPTEQSFQGPYRVLARSLLARSPGFDHCPAELLDELTEDAELARAATREVLVHRGEHSGHLLLVVEGALEARIQVADGRRHLLTFVLPGMLAGFLSFAGRGQQPHDLLAHMPSVVLRMPEKTVRRLCQTRVELLQAFHTQLAERSRLLYDALAYNQSYALRDRLARQLVTLADTVGLPRGERWTLALQMSQADLADLLGAGRQSVNAELQRLQDEGLVRIARSRIEVLDLAVLRARLPADMPALQARVV